MVHSTDAKMVERDGASSPASVDADEIARLADRYTFRNAEEVTRYLHKHPVLIPLLVQAEEVIPRYFDVDVPVVLEVVFDPECYDPEGELFASIQIPETVDDALDRLDRFDDEWWLRVSPNAPDTLVFDIEYV